MAAYQEIIRVANAWPEMEEWEKTEKMVSNGALSDALSYLYRLIQQGGRGMNTTWKPPVYDRPTDPDSTGDTVVCEKDGLFLCRSSASSGLYDAFYLTLYIPEG